jgi:hypothetical protein
MPSWETEKSDFDELCKMWDKAQDANIFRNPKAKDYQDDYSSMPSDVGEDEANLWSDVYNRGEYRTEDGDGSILNEARAKSGKKTKSVSDFEEVPSSLENKPASKSRKRKVRKVANQPNKVAPDTIDSDSVDDSDHVRVSAGFGADPNFDEIVDLHHKKYEKEVERNKAYPNDEKKIEKLEKEIKKLKDQIAKLSDEFYGNYTDNEYYT